MSILYERQIQLNFYNLLIEEYGYKRNNIELEFKIRMGSSYKRADIVVFFDGMKHTQQNIYMIIEVKRSDEQKTKQAAFHQIYSYISACGNSKYAVLVLKNQIAAFHLQDKSKQLRQLTPISGVPYGYNAEQLVLSNMVDSSKLLEDSNKYSNSSNLDNKPESDMGIGCIIAVICFVICFAICFINPLLGGAFLGIFISIYGMHLAIKVDSMKKKRE